MLSRVLASAAEIIAQCTYFRVKPRKRDKRERGCKGGGRFGAKGV